MKKFILGFITGGIICAAVTGFAVEYAVTANPYPVKVNGSETAIEGYNINDNTYFKLRDVADAVGGFDVGFSDDTITIDTETAPEPTDAPNVIKPTLDPNKKYDFSALLEYYTDDGREVYNIDGVYYLSSIDLDVHADLDWRKFDRNYLLESAYDVFVPLDYYQNVVLANIDQFKKD